MFQCIYVAQFLYFFICRLISRLLPCPSYCKKGCKEYWGICISFRTAKNIGAPASLSGMVSSGYMPSSGFVGSYDSSFPSFFFFFFRNPHTDFHSDFINLLFHQQCKRVPISTSSSVFVCNFFF